MPQPIKALLTPCCNCRLYWVAVFIRGDRYLETRNVRAENEQDAKRAIGVYVSRHYGEPLSPENVT